jgi:hypothetical protein
LCRKSSIRFAVRFAPLPSFAGFASFEEFLGNLCNRRHDSLQVHNDWNEVADNSERSSPQGPLCNRCFFPRRPATEYRKVKPSPVRSRFRKSPRHAFAGDTLVAAVGGAINEVAFYLIASQNKDSVCRTRIKDIVMANDFMNDRAYIE